MVEGRYDKNALSQVVDAVILETGGFGIFNDSQKQKLLRTVGEKRGIIIMTDPDGAGFVIRNFIKSCVPPEYIKNAYVPDTFGKERRKRTPSKEGKLGVEGMRPQVLLDALRRAGATIDDVPSDGRNGDTISKTDMYMRGLSGGENSRALRLKLMKKLELPEHMSADALLDVLNSIMTRDEFMALQL